MENFFNFFKNLMIEKKNFQSTKFQNEIYDFVLQNLEENKMNANIAIYAMKKLSLDEEHIDYILKNVKNHLNQDLNYIQLQEDEYDILESNINDFQNKIFNYAGQLFYGNHNYEIVERELLDYGLSHNQTREVINKLQIKNSEDALRRSNEGFPEDSEETIIHIFFHNKESLYTLNFSNNKNFFIYKFDNNQNIITEINLKTSDKIDFIKDFIIFEDEQKQSIILNAQIEGNVFCLELNLKGDVLDKTLISKKYDDIVLLLNKGEILNFKSNLENSSHDVIYLLNKESKEVLKIDLLDESLYEDKEWPIEYVECLTKMKAKNQFAFIGHNPTCGVQEVKIVELTTAKTINIIYDIDLSEFDGSIHNLTFNSDTNKFCILLYQTQNNENGDIFSEDGTFINYYSIYEYSLNGNKAPVNKIDTDFAYWENSILSTQYLTDNIFSVISHKDIVIYDLENNGIIEIIERDCSSAYFVDFNTLIYQKGGKILIKEYNK